MSITGTSLAAAFGANDRIFQATSATGATVGGYYKIDEEIGIVAEINGTAITTKRRGNEGSKAVAHNILAPVTFFLPADTPTLGKGETVPGPGNREITSYGASGAITLPKRDTVALITKATAAAMTLENPSKLSDGILLTIVSTTAAAHTVTLVTGVVGSSASDVFTFTAAVGAAIQLMSYKGLWAHISTGLAADESAAVAVA